MHKVLSLTESCILCASQKASLYQTAEEPYRTVRCQGCGLIFVDPLPPENQLKYHYDEVYYAEWISAQKKSRELLWRRRLAQLLEHRKRGRLLDVGCGVGAFLGLAKKAGFEAFGTEVSEYAGRRTEEICGVPVFIGNLEEAGFPSDYFDVVTLYHVIEHVNDPSRYLFETHRILKPGGLVVVACPNVESYVFNLAYFVFKRKRFQLFSTSDKEIHLYHFSPRTLEKLLVGHEFRLLSLGLDDPNVDPRKRIVEWVARGLYRITGKNCTMAMKALAVKSEQMEDS
jgi:ubiquinone/menaquinone biosynthesis C-methylase UbiE